jgi:hypothetical protein
MRHRSGFGSLEPAGLTGQATYQKDEHRATLTIDHDLEGLCEGRSHV